jgi:hypothetical protein
MNPEFAGVQETLASEGEVVVEIIGHESPESTTPAPEPVAVIPTPEPAMTILDLPPLVLPDLSPRGLVLAAPEVTTTPNPVAGHPKGAAGRAHDYEHRSAA